MSVNNKQDYDYNPGIVFLESTKFLSSRSEPHLETA